MQHFIMIFRICPVMFVIKSWAINHKLSGRDSNRKEIISSYAVILLVIFYFQHEQILPSIKALQANMENKDSFVISKYGKNIETGFPKDISLWTRCCLSKKNKTMADFVHGFFQFYAKFDYEKCTVSPNTGMYKIR